MKKLSNFWSLKGRILVKAPKCRDDDAPFLEKKKQPCPFLCRGKCSEPRIRGVVSSPSENVTGGKKTTAQRRFSLSLPSRTPQNEPQGFLLSGTTLDNAGDAAVEGGDTGFSESIVARRLFNTYKIND